MDDIPRPFLKWAGGKSGLLGQFADLYPGQFRRYIEPFVGGGAVYFDVARRLAPSDVLLADENEELIGAYVAIRDDLDAMIDALETHRRKHSKTHYYEVRAANPRSRVARAARLVYLNKTCFNGLYRVNSKGRFNVPMGQYTNPKILDEPNLRAVAAALSGVDLRVAHFRETLTHARKGDFVYFDPPYHPLSKTAKFTSYTDLDFGEADQQELAEVFATLARRGCLVMLSNSDNAFVRALYGRFHVEQVFARRSINSRGDRRGAIAEVVVRSWEPWQAEESRSRAATS